MRHLQPHFYQKLQKILNSIMIHTHKNMKWDYEKNLPVEGTYQHREYDKEKLKSYIEEHFPYDVVRLAFESVDWNLEALMLRKDLDLGESFYMSILKDWKDCLIDYWIDIVNGHICTLDFKGQKWRGTLSPIHVCDFLKRCFFCETEEDIWDLFHDLPFWAENNLKECYYGYSPITWFPVYTKDPCKAITMHEYLYGKSEDLGILLHLGSKMGVLDEYEYTGTIVGLAEDHIAVRIDYPLECTISYHVPGDSRDKIKLAVVIDNQYVATEYTHNMALGMLSEIHSEERFILKDVEKLHDMFVEYQQKKDTNVSFWFISELKQKYFPDGAEDIEFNEDLMSQIESYLEDNYCED